MTTLLYFVKRGHDNEELRYSLRSLEYFPHDRVVIVGHKPRWVTGVEFHQGNPTGSKWMNVHANLRIACEKVPGEFVVMNDDIFFQHPTTDLPSLHRGLLTDHIESIPQVRSAWRRSLESTHRVLGRLGIGHPLSYEAHIPVLMDAERLSLVLEHGARERHPPQWRTMYGNVWRVPAQRIVDDVKIRKVTTPWDRDAPFVSTDDRTWEPSEAGQHIRSLFPDPSPYEVT